jgi:hypothetical protein
MNGWLATHNKTWDVATITFHSKWLNNVRFRPSSHGFMVKFYPKIKGLAHTI